MRESLQNKLSGNESTNNTLISVENIDAEIDLLTASLRSSPFRKKTTDQHFFRKMLWWNRKLYGLLYKLRQACNNFQKYPNTENCQKVRELKGKY